MRKKWGRDCLGWLPIVSQSPYIWNINAEQGSAELGYGIVLEHQGQGLMKEALLCVIEYGFGVMGLKLLEAYTEESHTQSRRLLERAGFSKIKTIDEQGYLTDRVYRMVVYTLDTTVGT